jgi:leader peptidase (prepilin peptidase)/N-methyltransferase
VPISSLITYGVVAFFGLALGSFLNVCIVRLPRHESVVRPRSHCPHCRTLIRWFDNIPLLSFLLLRGRCRNCGARISILYPAVELLTGGLLVATFARYALSSEFIKHAVLVMLLLVLIFTDLRERRIPHAVTLLGIGLGLLLSLIVRVDSRPLGWLMARLGIFWGETPLSVMGAVTGGIVGGGVFYAVGEAFYYLGGKQKEYLGFGDVMLMLMVGTFLGVPLTLLTMIVGSLLGTLIALPLELTLPRFRHFAWPYGTFLGGAAILASLYGERVIDAYLRWSGLAR